MLMGLCWLEHSWIPVILEVKSSLQMSVVWDGLWTATFHNIWVFSSGKTHSFDNNVHRYRRLVTIDFITHFFASQPLRERLLGWTSLSLPLASGYQSNQVPQETNMLIHDNFKPSTILDVFSSTSPKSGGTTWLKAPSSSGVVNQSCHDFMLCFLFVLLSKEAVV